MSSQLSLYPPIFMYWRPNLGLPNAQLPAESERESKAEIKKGLTESNLDLQKAFQFHVY